MKRLGCKNIIVPLFLLSIGFLLGHYFPYLLLPSTGSSSVEPSSLVALDVSPSILSKNVSTEKKSTPHSQQRALLSSSAGNNLSATDNEMKSNPSVLFSPAESLGRISNTIEQNPQIDLTSELLAKFEREEVDVEWAYQQEVVVRDFFLDHPALADISPNSIECKTNRCRIQLPLVNIEDGNELSVAISSAISSSPEFSKYSIAAGFNYERAVLEIYLPRDADFNLLQ